MIIVTGNEIPGFQIVAVHGEVMGLTVRARDFGQSWVAGWRAIGGGELPEFTSLLVESRHEVMGRMVTPSRAVLTRSWPCASTAGTSVASGRKSAPTAPRSASAHSAPMTKAQPRNPSSCGIGIRPCAREGRLRLLRQPISDRSPGSAPMASRYPLLSTGSLPVRSNRRSSHRILRNSTDSAGYTRFVPRAQWMS